MSVVASIIKNNYSMIATDSRITLKENSIKLYEDRYSKLFHPSFGWMAGMGYWVFIENFNNMLKQQGISNTADILRIWKEAFTFTKKTKNNEKLDTTVISYSYRDKINSKMQIGILNPQSGDCISLCNENGLVSFLPDMSEQMSIVEQKYRNPIEESKSMEELIYNMACYFEEVSLFTEYVSDIIDCGFMMETDTTIEFLKIREPIDTIKHAYKKGTLDKHIELIGSMNI